jgi:uncharacterized protein (TIGR02996 family)
MSDEEALVRAVIDMPGDETVKLVYADWLDENGYPERAEWVRLVVEYKRLSPVEERYSIADLLRGADIEKRRKELLTSIEIQSWLDWVDWMYGLGARSRLSKGA